MPVYGKKKTLDEAGAFDERYLLFFKKLIWLAQCVFGAGKFIMCRMLLSIIYRGRVLNMVQARGLSFVV